MRLRGVARTFPGGVEAVGGIDLDVPPGQFLAILGESGCGKSTLLRLIAGLDRPDEGRIDLASPSIAYVFQDPHLMPWRNVVRNVALPLELRGVPRERRLQTAMEALRQVGLEEAARRYPGQLSGGMRMRVSLARALVTDPTLLLLDEPFAALDELTRQRLDEQLQELWRRRRMTVVFVTHSISEAAFLAQRAVILSPRPARVVCDRAIELPQPRRLALRGEPEFARQVRWMYEAMEATADLGS